MSYLRRVLAAIGLMLVLGGCSLFGDDGDGTDLSATEQITPQPTVNNVQPIPAATQPPAVAQPAQDQAATDEAPTPVTLPPPTEAPTATPDRSQPQTYVVQQGDVLGIIAERFDVEIGELRSANNLSGNLIKVGQSLTIPAIGGETEVAAPAAAPTSAPAPAAPAAPVSCGAGASGHCVQPGESLLGIASKYGVSVDALRSANPSISGDLIRVGDLLTIPGSTPAAAPTSAPVTGGSDPVVGATGTPLPTLPPATNAQCVEANPDFPYFHDGKCYANPIGPTPEPTTLQSDFDQECPSPGGVPHFLWTDGICYPVPGATAEPTTPTATPTGQATATPDPEVTPASFPEPAEGCPAGYFSGTSSSGRPYCFLSP